MVYSQAPIPFSRGSAKPRVFLHNIVPDSLGPFLEDSQKALVFDALRHQISGGASIEDVLESAASAARELTSASGAAVAMGADEHVLCVGRSGETAPPLGAQVSVDSGISGECMRSGKSLICDDTQLDPRVDADVCLGLGLRSLAAVPLRAPGDSLGLLEVFSNYPANFSREHLETLRGLGDLIELAYTRASVKEIVPETRAEEKAEVQAPTAATEDSLSEPRAIDWLRDSQSQAGEQKFPYWAVPVVLIVVLLCFRGWMAWHEPAKLATAPLQTATQDLPETLTLVQKPTPTRNSPRRRVSREQATDPQSSEAPEVVVRNFEETPSVTQANASQAAAQESEEPPQMPVLRSNEAELTNLVAKQATMPKAAMPVSQGVVRGGITYRVAPSYPKDALAQGLWGLVVLKATIDEKGTVEHVAAVSGPQALARAAIDAVRQWRYQPSLLNGTPVSVETEITVNFKKP